MSTYFWAILVWAASTWVATAADLTLAWDPSPDTNVTKYILYVQQVGSSDAPNLFDMGNSNTGTISGLVPGTTYQIYIAAWIRPGLESTASNMIFWTPQAAILDASSVAVATTMPVLYRAINIGGGPLTIYDNSWEGQDAPNYSSSPIFFNQREFQLLTPAEPNVAAMLTTGAYGSDLSVQLTTVPAGSYSVFIWAFENAAPVTCNLLVQGTSSGSFSTGGSGWWERIGPFPATVSDGNIQVELQAENGAVIMSGVELWRMP
jgi:hypothetical protein